MTWFFEFIHFAFVSYFILLKLKIMKMNSFRVYISKKCKMSQVILAEIIGVFKKAEGSLTFAFTFL